MDARGEKVKIILLRVQPYSLDSYFFKLLLKEQTLLLPFLTPGTTDAVDSIMKICYIRYVLGVAEG